MTEIIDSAEFDTVPKIECGGGSSRRRRGIARMMDDPNQPSPQALAQVNNKNNLAEMRLRRVLAQVERERISRMTLLKQDRLEAMNLLHAINTRESDKDPAYLKHFKDLALSSRRNNMTMSAPAGLTLGSDLRTRLRPRRHRHHTTADHQERRASVANEHDVNEANVQRLLLGQEQGDHTNSSSAQKGCEVIFTEQKTDVQETPYITSIAEDSNNDTNQSVMAEVIEKKLKPARKEPLQKRITTFLAEVKEYKEVKAKAENEYLDSARMKRQWTLMTKGIDAALAESSDEEDGNEQHTI
ncbi:uncharacterized protein LOC135486818 [Lineus longissimus]|uniref:uncharacterized protein LOC135486818 n=1 Tax=Lineus longissimus TaxID=88925 RepID=UPI00315DB4EA